MNNASSLSHVSKFKGDKGKMSHPTGIYSHTMQNSSGRHKEHHHAKSFQLLL
jgi:hypothetical protein